MSITARVRQYITFSGDVDNEYIFDTGTLPNSPGVVEMRQLTIGDNVFTLPDAINDVVVHGVALIPPNGNTVEILLKGDETDTLGIPLSLQQATVIQFGAVLPIDIVLEVDDEVNGFRLIWF